MFPKIGVPQNGWFRMENPIEMDDLGLPLFSETSNYSFLCFVIPNTREIYVSYLIEMHQKYIFLLNSRCLKNISWFFVCQEFRESSSKKKKHQTNQPITALKINIEPENDGLEDDFPLPGGAFSGSMLIFRGV